MKARRIMKKLGEGYIWFGCEKGSLAYTNVSLATKPNRADGNRLVEIKLHRLGAWQKVRLWAEVIKETK